MRLVTIMWCVLILGLIFALMGSPAQAKIDEVTVEQCGSQWERLRQNIMLDDIHSDEDAKRLIDFFTLLGNDLYHGLSVKTFFEICASNQCFDERTNLLEMITEGKRLSRFCLGEDKGRMRLGLEPSSPECGQRIEKLVFAVKYGMSGKTREEFVEHIITWQQVRLFLFGMTENVERYFEQCLPHE